MCSPAAKELDDELRIALAPHDDAGVLAVIEAARTRR